jgi:hypothetical protein
MQAGYFEVEIPSLRDKHNSFRVVECSFSNYINTLCGSFTCDIVGISRQELYEVNSLMPLQPLECKVKYTNGITSFYFLKGLVFRREPKETQNGCSVRLYISHHTYLMQKVSVQNFESFEIGNARETINNLFVKTKTNQLYDYVVYPAKAKEQLDAERISGKNDLVWNVLENILNDMHAKIFTTTNPSNGKNTLYIYDTGELIDENEQYIGENIIQYNLKIDVSRFVVKAKLKSEQGLSSIDLREVGETAVYRKKQKEQDTTVASVKLFSIGGSILEQTEESKRLNLPDISFYGVLKGGSTKQDIYEYTTLKIRESLDDGISIEVEVPSFFIDPLQPSKGIWNLGGRVDIRNSSMINMLNPHFKNYLQNKSNAFFVIKGIQTDGITTTLILGLSDLVRIYS